MNLEIWPALVANWASPGIIFFGVGGIAGLAKSELRFPRSLRVAATVLLLIVLGFQGGLGLAEVGLRPIWKQTLAALAFGAVMPLWMWPCLKFLGRRDSATAGLGATQLSFGNVGVFAATAGYLKINGEFADDLSAGFLLLLPFSALIMGGFLTGCIPPRPAGKPWWTNARLAAIEALRSSNFVVLVASFLSGFLASHTRAESFFAGTPLLVPALGLILMLDLGLGTGRHWGRMKGVGWILAGFAVVAPVINAGAALYLARRAHLQPGMGTLLAMLASTGPAALAPRVVRRVFPGGQTGLISALEMGIALPLNILIGMPVYWQLAHRYL